MKTFTMNAKEYTPAVLLDANKGIIEIAGKSFPEDAVRFYKPLFKWIDEYLLIPNSNTKLNLKFTYYNTSSAKKILELIKKVSLLQNSGNKLEIFWYYDEGDEDMLNAGYDYSSVVEIPFKFVEMKPNI
jgi:hypothetical protein